MTLRELLAATSIVRHRSWAIGIGAGGSLSRGVFGWGVDFGRYGIRFHYPRVTHPEYLEVGHHPIRAPHPGRRVVRLRG